MMNATFFPVRNTERPAFWFENIWAGVEPSSSMEFKETDQAYFMSVELPGVNKSNLDLQVQENTLHIKATKKKAAFGNDETEKKISRSYVLPADVDVDKIEAHCEDGILYLALPKVERAKPRKIELIEK